VEERPNPPFHRASVAGDVVGSAEGSRESDRDPELKQTLTDGVLQEAGKHSVAQLAAAENEVLPGLLGLRAEHG
jgi:hypothetical protein